MYALAPSNIAYPICNIHRTQRLVIKSSLQPLPSSQSYIIRRLTSSPSDIDQCAAICHRIFSADDQNSSLNNNNGTVKKKRVVRGNNKPRTEEEWKTQITSAVEGKNFAQQESRKFNVYQNNKTMQVDKARQRGERVSRNATALTLEQKAKIRQWRRKKSFISFVAIDPTTSTILGCATISLARPEAQLPPPFPTSSLFRCYISNMVVVDSARRLGIASRLLHQCERIARFWGYDSVWLHVDGANLGAAALYSRGGYQEVKVETSGLVKVLRAVVVGGGDGYKNEDMRLLRKVLPPVVKKTKSSVGVGVEGYMGDSGVFVWGGSSGVESGSASSSGTGGEMKQEEGQES